MGAAGSTPTQGTPPAISVPAQSTEIFSDVWQNSSQKLILDADSVADGGHGSFFDIKTNQFYSRIILTPNAATNYPRNYSIEMTTFTKGDFVIGHELNNNGTQFTLQFTEYVQMRRNGSGGGLRGKNLTPGTYTCTVAGLGIEDPAPGSNKLCVISLKGPTVKIVSYPVDTNVVYDNIVKRY